MAYQELLRGWYAVNAFDRVAQAQDQQAALQTERRYLEQHRRAERQRDLAADLSDLAAERYGDILSWNLGPNPNHCRICLLYAGNNFSNLNGTVHGRPGTVHGDTCQCFAGPPIQGAPTLA